MLDQCGQFLRVITSWPARTAFTILAVVGAAGCIPVLREQYYSPEADGATVAPSRCGGGPKAIAEFTVDSVRVGYGLLPGDDSVRPMMSFLVPEGRTVRLLETRMTIQPSGDQGEVRFINLGTNAVGREPLFADQAMVGKTKQHSFPQRFQEHAFYVASTTMALAPPKTVMVTFPRFLIGDRLVDARMMRFHLDRHVQFMAPINC